MLVLSLLTVLALLDCLGAATVQRQHCIALEIMCLGSKRRGKAGLY